MKTIHVLDFRHYSRQKPTDEMSKNEAARIKTFQPPSERGFWECEELARILRDMKVFPLWIITSPQPRAYLAARLVTTHVPWMEKNIRIDDRLNDVSSDPAAKKVIEAVKSFMATEEGAGLSTEKAFLVSPDSLACLWGKSHEGLKALTEIAAEIPDGETVVLFSHGASIELRAIRLMIMAAGTPLDQQTPDDVDLTLLDQHGGMLDECEGFTYDLTLSASCKICGAQNFSTIRLPEYPG